jgi:RNA polymerase sigma-70 factor (ECF subfamily)
VVTSLRSLSDQQLVSLLKEGSAAAYTELFDRYQPLLYIYSCKIVKDEDEAADLVQEVFLYVWDKKDSIEFNSSVLAYLYSAVRYKFFNLLDKRKVRNDYASSFRKFMEEGAPTTDDYLREKEMLRLIEYNVSLLPQKLKQIYELSRIANMTNTQIAEVLGISEKTVQNQLSLAIRQLKLKLTLQSFSIIMGSTFLFELLKKR